jgi:hypothetical protein
MNRGIILAISVLAVFLVGGPVARAFGSASPLIGIAAGVVVFVVLTVVSASVGTRAGAVRSESLPEVRLCLPPAAVRVRGGSLVAPVGLESPNSPLAVLFAAETSVPCTRWHDFRVPGKQRPNIRFGLVHMCSDGVSRESTVGEFTLSEPTQSTAVDQHIPVRFTVLPDGAVEMLVRATDSDSRFELRTLDEQS